jgi:hypothetical protein
MLIMKKSCFGIRIQAGVKVTASRKREVGKVQEVATLNTGSFYAILSESENRMSIESIPLYKSFQHADLPEISSVTEEDVNRIYTRIKMDIKNLVEGA